MTSDPMPDTSAAAEAAVRAAHDESTQPPIATHDDEGNALLGGYPLAGTVRRVRRTADLSQRELARAASVSPAAIGAIESGAITPSLHTLLRVLAAAGYQLLVADENGRLVRPLLVWPEVCDLAGRRFPAHLDTILDPVYGEWWADVYGLTAPPETFRRSRALRDYLRRRSRWEVRVKQLRHVEPPWPPRNLAIRDLDDRSG